MTDEWIEPAILTPGKVVMIGQAPGRTDPRPMAGAVGRTLADYMQIGQQGGHELRLAVYFDRVNLIPEYPGPDGKGDAFPFGVARRNAALLWAHLTDYARVLVIGKQTWHALKSASPYVNDRRDTPFRDLPPFEWQRHPRETYGLFAWIPHPSKINTWWNDRANQSQARGFLLDLAGRMRQELI